MTTRYRKATSAKGKNLYSNPKFAHLIEKAKLDIQEFWKANVNQYFTAASRIRSSVARSSHLMAVAGHTGQMANSCRVTILNDEMVVIFKAMHSADGKDYGDFLVFGTEPSLGAYSPEINARIRNKITGELVGMTRGISTTQWDTWKTVLVAYMDERVNKLDDEIYAASGIEDIVGGEDDI